MHVENQSQKGIIVLLDSRSERIDVPALSEETKSSPILQVSTLVELREAQLNLSQFTDFAITENFRENSEAPEILKALLNISSLILKLPKTPISLYFPTILLSNEEPPTFEVESIKGFRNLLFFKLKPEIKELHLAVPAIVSGPEELFRGVAYGVFNDYLLFIPRAKGREILH